jgi:outer membrane lipoprotein-sorting protein
MKKIYLLTSMFMIGGVAFGQLAQPKSPSIFTQNTPSEQLENGIKPGPSGAAKGVPVWTEDFGGIGTPPASTAGPTFTTSNGTWTTGGANANLWKHSFSTTSGEWSNGTPAFATTTAANGFMLIDADSVNFITSPTYNNFTAELISPNIDLTGESSVQLNFEQDFRFCCAATMLINVSVSSDGGSTWSSPYDMTSAVATNQAYSTFTGGSFDVSANISADAAGNNVMLKFTWDGVGAGMSHYYWNIDDINITSAPAFDLDLTITDYFMTTPNVFGGLTRYTGVPIAQIEPIMFTGTVANVGQNTANNAQLDVVVMDGSSSTVFTGNDNAGMPNLAAPMVQEDTVLSFSPAGAVDQFTFDYAANYDDIASDNTPANNVGQHTTFQVTQDEWFKDQDAYTGGGLWNGDDSGTPPIANPYVMCNTYTPVANANLTGIRTAVTASSAAGGILYCQVYEVDPATGDFNLVLDGSGTLWGEITLANGDISASAPTTYIDFDVTDGGSQPAYAMNAGTMYLVAVATYGGPEAVVIMNGGMQAEAQTVFLLDGTDNTWYFMTSTPVIRALFGQGIGIEEEAANGITLGQNMPNPTNGTTTINYSLEEGANVTFEVVDVTGKVVYTSNLGEMAEGSYVHELNAANFAAGVYYYSLIANKEKVTKKMVITE